MTMQWQPSATRNVMLARAKLYAQIRQFFAERAVLEVETPVLGRYTVTDVHITSIQAAMQANKAPLYCQTSPEYAMKRLLAAGSGAIYQISKVFRDEVCGQHHQHEFSLLEWYRPGFDDVDLMDEIDTLLAQVTTLPRAKRLSYREAFWQVLRLDPLHAPLPILRQAAISEAGVDASLRLIDRDDWLDCLLSCVVLPRLAQQQRCFFIVHYPASQAALAQLVPGQPALAQRFELLIDGMEIANGFHELRDPAEQRARFVRDNEKRAQRGLKQMALDPHLLAALAHGLPDCAGVALGLDRLLMAQLALSDITQVLTFPDRDNNAC